MYYDNDDESAAITHSWHKHHELFYRKIRMRSLISLSSSSKHSTNIRYNYIADFNRHATKCYEWTCKFSFTFRCFFSWGRVYLLNVVYMFPLFPSFQFFHGSPFCNQFNLLIFSTPFVKKKRICLVLQRDFFLSILIILTRRKNDNFFLVILFAGAWKTVSIANKNIQTQTEA